MKSQWVLALWTMSDLTLIACSAEILYYLREISPSLETFIPPPPDPGIWRWDGEIKASEYETSYVNDIEEEFYGEWTCVLPWENLFPEDLREKWWKICSEMKKE